MPLRNMFAFQRKFAQENQRQPSLEEIAQGMDVSVEEVLEIGEGLKLIVAFSMDKAEESGFAFGQDASEDAFGSLDDDNEEGLQQYDKEDRQYPDGSPAQCLKALYEHKNFQSNSTTVKELLNR